ncbi:hypothetical protein DENSPDRAFT_845043 [Dentipellis sp. KUC8613]|nr:hypothetical protein DENSPDRAFT_845043 [Dentipellis sp. KUC8613]
MLFCTSWFALTSTLADLVRAQRTCVSLCPPRTPFPSTGGMHAHTHMLTKCHRHGDNGPTVTTGLGM